MMVTKLSIILFLFCLPAMAQTNRASVWVMGQEGLQVKFGSQIITKSPLFPQSYFKQGNSNICDTAGNLLLFSDGFNIYNSAGNYLDGGDTLVPKAHFLAKSGWSLYSQTSIFLPMSNNKYYFITPAFSDSQYNECNLNNSCYFDLLLYNVIDMNANAGAGKVVKRMVPLMQNAQLRKTQMMACRHANGLDWWLLKQDGGDSNVVHTFLFTQDSVYDKGIQKFNTPVFGKWDLKGQSAFSLDGTLYATGTQGPYTGEFFLADFNRCQGTLSNGRSLFAPLLPADSPTHNFTDVVLSGICFSPNKQFIYVTFQYNIFQYDRLDSTWYHVANLDTTYQAFQAYTTAYLANDNKIYIGNFGGLSKQMSRIDNPVIKGVGCNFCARCLRFDSLGAFANAGTPPCMPNYALGKDTSSCWPLALSNEIVAIKENELIVYPNPANKIVNIKYKNTDDTQLEIINVLGQKVAEIFLPHNAQIVNSSVETLGNGVYNYRQTQNGKCINAGKLIIEN
jgi:hypothetical protein